MENMNEFIDSMVRIELIEAVGMYGHFPFQLMADIPEGLVLAALDLGDVVPCYQTFANYLGKGATKAFMSVDFPAGGDMAEDFVAVFGWVDGAIEVVALPYSTADGTQSPRVTTAESKLLAEIKQQFEMALDLFKTAE